MSQEHHQSGQVSPKSSKPRADWEAIELQYRAGIKTSRVIGEEFGVSHTMVNRKAKELGWTRDLSAKIQAKADAMVARSEVSRDVSKERLETEKAIVDAGAEAIVRVRLTHRKDIRRGQAIIQSLYDELELTCGPENAAMVAELGELMREPDDRGQDKRNEVYQKLMSLPGRIKAAKELGEALKSLIGLEREAYSINSEPPAPPAETVADAIDVLAARYGKVRAKLEAIHGA